MIKILVVGTIPPPYHGQAIMIQTLLDTDYSDIKFYRVRAAFSKDINGIRKFNIGTVFGLVRIIYNIICIRLKNNVTCLYFGPGRPNLIPMYRDVIMHYVA